MSLRATLAGTVALVAGAAALLAGVLTGRLALVLAGWSALLACAASAGRTLRSPPPEAQLLLPPLVRAGTPAVIDVSGPGGSFRVEGRRWQPLPGSFSWAWHDAGTRDLPRIAVRRTDASRLWRRVAHLPDRQVAVVPSAADVAGATAAARTLRANLRAPGRGILRDPADPEGLREWQEGSPARNIDWKASSRHEQILEKEFTRLRELDFGVVLDATAAARRREGPQAPPPLEVGLDAALHIVSWARARRRRAVVAVCTDEPEPLLLDMGGTQTEDELRRLVESLPPALPEGPAPAGAGDEAAFLHMLRRLRGAAPAGPLAAAVRGLAQRPRMAVFLVSPLAGAPAQVHAVASAARRGYRAVVQVDALTGAAATADDLRRLYPMAVRRRRNADLLASSGWVVVDARAERPAGAVLREAALASEARA
ncbi:MAG TPA: DUF58 domain-containing protein [Candidatus Thermoplasmatota archaeon]|nr:DUF58 domain-containing protein [Candidatus Thermoplasmatota archaeon]